MYLDIREHPYQSTKFGTHVLWAKAKLFAGGSRFKKGQGQTSLIAICCHLQNNFRHPFLVIV